MMWDPWADARAAADLQRRLQWLLIGRLAAILGFVAGLVAPLLRSGGERDVVPLGQLLLVAAAACAFIVASAVALRRTKRVRLLTHAHIGFDILLTTGAVYLTGGVGSPFSVLYCLAIINAAGLHFGRGALISAVLSAVAYDLLVLGLVSGLLAAPDHPASAPIVQPLDVTLRLIATNAGFLIIAGLAGVLTRRLHSGEQVLSEQRAERDRVALLQRTLSQATSAGLIVTDTDGRVIAADPTIEGLTGQAAAGLHTLDIGSVFPPLQLVPSARLRLMQTMAPLPPLEFAHRNGETAIHLRCIAASLRDTYGNPMGTLYIVQDVTRMQDLERLSPLAELDDRCRDDLEAAAEIADASDGLYGVSAAMRRTRAFIERVATVDTTVLITGESGTGKELVARAIHARSARRDRPFVAVNCGAIPEHLIESELFGHVRGAFTGAVADRAGCFRMADRGTLFLDEIAELPPQLQVKLLRVLQERTFRAVGDDRTLAVDVRVIAASNRDIDDALRTGQLREDLYYRINVMAVALPALRERREDIPLLIRHVLRRCTNSQGRHVIRFSVGASRRLLQHDYPGNIRELENIVEHAVALCDGETAGEEHLPHYLLDHERPDAANGKSADVQPSPITVPKRLDSADLERDLAEYEKAVLLRALGQARGVKKRAAELLGINYRSLRHRLHKYGLNEVDVRGGRHDAAPHTF